MKKKNIILSIIICTLLASPLFARDLSIDQAVAEGINKSSQILSATLDIKSAQIDEDGKYSSFYPTVSVGLTASRSNEKSSYGTQFTSLTGSITSSFNFNPAMITSLQTTALQLEAKNITLEKAKSDLEIQIKKLYYGVLVQQAALDVLQKNVDYMNETLLNTQAAYENGDIPELSVLQLQSQIASQNATLEKSQTAIVSQKRTLAFLIGADNITEDLNLTTELPTTFTDDLSEYTLDKAINSSIDLESARINKSILDVNKQALHESTYIPSLSLSASYMPTASDITAFDITDYSGTTIDYGSISATVAFNISNLLPGSSTQTSIKKLDLSYEQLEQGMNSIKESIILSYNSNIEAIKEAKRQIDLSKDSINLSQKSFDLTSLSYENGDTSFSDLQSAQLSVSSARLGLLQSQYTYLSALLDLENQCTR
jgi:outer membrane protein TolC